MPLGSRTTTSSPDLRTPPAALPAEVVLLVRRETDDALHREAGVDQVAVGSDAALASAARHPDKAATVIAHEPPIADLVPDAPYIRAVVDVEDPCRADGPRHGARFVSFVMHEGGGNR